MGASRSEIIKQYNRAKKFLWTEHFREAANTYTPDLFDTADLMAIGSRETNLDPKWLTRKGDNGHGAGLMQIDDRSFPEFTSSTKWKDARLGILYGAKVLRQKWDDLKKNAGKTLLFKNRYLFEGPTVSGATAQRIAIAAYNSGRAAAYHYSKGRNPDSGTTGKDYSADVIARARIFRELLAKDGMLDSAAAHGPGPSTGDTSAPTPQDGTQTPNDPPPPTEPVTLTSVTTSIWTKIVAAATGLTGIGINAGTIIESQLSGITFNHVLIILLGVAVIVLGIFYYKKRQEAADLKNAELLRIASDPNLQTVELKRK